MRQQIFEEALKQIAAIASMYTAPEAEVQPHQRLSLLIGRGDRLRKITRIANRALNRSGDPAGMSATQKDAPRD